MIPFHLIACWFFIHRCGYGMLGAAYAETFTGSLTVCLQVIYISTVKEIRAAWYLPTLKTFYELGTFLQLAIPGAAMLFLENLNMEILVLMAGLLGNADQLAAQVIVVTIAELAMMVPYGLSLGAVTLVG